MRCLKLYNNKLSIQHVQQLHDDGNGNGVLQFEHPFPESEEDEDYIDTGAAILNFYCTLVDLLGRCAPDSSVIEQGSYLYLCNCHTSKNHVTLIWKP